MERLPGRERWHKAEGSLTGLAARLGLDPGLSRTDESTRRARLGGKNKGTETEGANGEPSSYLPGQPVDGVG